MSVTSVTLVSSVYVSQVMSVYIGGTGHGALQQRDKTGTIQVLKSLVVGG